MAHPIINKIEEGEHLHQDFKFEISDAKKIARSFAAFSNTDGGRLLVGVKDNGVIYGVRSDEEFYMLESAANLYCKPNVEYSVKEWEINGRMVLEVNIPKNEDVLVSAPDKNGKHKVYIRVNDQNLLANRWYIKVWKHKNRKGTFLRYREKEELLIKYLEDNHKITYSKIKNITGLNSRQCDNFLIKMLTMEIINMKITEKDTYFTLPQDNE